MSDDQIKEINYFRIGTNRYRLVQLGNGEFNYQESVIKSKTVNGEQEYYDSEWADMGRDRTDGRQSYLLALGIHLEFIRSKKNPQKLLDTLEMDAQQSRGKER